MVRTSLIAQSVKNLPAMQETWIRTLGWEDPLEKEVANNTPVLLPGKSQGQRSLAGYSPWDQRVSSDLATKITANCLFNTWINIYRISCSSVAKLCPTLCDPMDCSKPGSSNLHHLPEFAQIHVHRVGDAI